VTRIAPHDLVHLLRLRAEEHPHRGYSFFTDGDPAPALMSFAELDRRARSIAAALAAHRVEGEPVLILCPPGLDFIAAFFGCLYAGAIATPAYPPDPARLARTIPRLRAIARDTRARVVVSTDAIASLRVDDAPDLQRLFWLSAEVGTGAGGAWRQPRFTGDRVALLQYTSGSTTDPKGVMVSHQNLLHNLEMIASAFDFGPRSRLAFWLPPYHDMGLIGGILAPLHAGGEVALMSPTDFLRRPMCWLEMISKTRADTTGAPNFAFDLVVRKSRPAERRSLDLSCLSLAFNAAEPVRPETMDGFEAAFAPAGFSRRSLFTCYGLAESTLLATATVRRIEPKRTTARSRTRVSLGRVRDGTLTIVDPETGVEVAPGEVGEIWIESASVARGYWKREEETKETFGALLRGGEGPFLRTGDLGFVDADGELYFESRAKEVIIIRGENRFPQDIERALEGVHPALRPGCGVAFGIERDGEERVAIVWEVERASLSDPNAVVACIRAALAEREGLAVDAVILIEAKTLPKTSSGKLMRRQTKEDFLSGTLSPVVVWRAQPEEAVFGSSPRGASVDEFLIERVAALIGVGVEAIDPELPLYEYGLDSKRAVELAADLSARTGRALPATLAFSYPTISALARHLSGRK
jgi:acyl-CoA synthetase (AMP-forming)/AMP-acid ligase II/acyl carrier protein